MTEKFDSDDVPKAHHYDLFFCGHCPNAHLIYFDEQERPLLHATISAQQADRIAERIRDNDPNFREIR